MRPRRAATAAQLAHAVVRDAGELDVLLRDRDAAGIEAREVEQVGRELRAGDRPARAWSRGSSSRRRRVGVVLEASSRKPPSAVSGVRSSWEALAMNVLRALRRAAPSWMRMASSERARSAISSLPVIDDGLVEASRPRSARRAPGAVAAGA